MNRFLLSLGLLTLAASAAFTADDHPAGQPPKDSRLGPPKTLNAYFPFTPPAGKEAWEARRKQVREQVLVANGLWPMPEKIPLKPTIHGKVERDGYTIEKVFFASLPGHYVTGNLYRPTGKAGKRPAVLCPHGHWANGRFYDAGEAGAKAQIAKGAEKTMEGARYPLQARCAQLARMGCVVFFYDMVGYADSQQIPHRAGFTDAEAELRLQNFMGLQTFNSIRALDFLLSLPEVDAARVGVTGASGGGTQTFILCGIDDRPAAAFPAVMVSTAMQGGCICENASYLRIGTGNIELAGLFAPKPLGMTGANDWTIEIEKKGLPELKALYKLLGAEDRVMAKTHAEFEHNYNQVSREIMYNFFNKHLKLGQPEPVAEKPFVPVPPKELSVFDKDHPLPKDAVDAQGLRRYLTQASEKQLAGLLPRDEKSLYAFWHTVGPALRVMVNDDLPQAAEVGEVGKDTRETQDGVTVRKYFLSRKGKGEAVPATEVRGPGFNHTVVVWVHPQGAASLWQDGKLVPAARQILDRKAGILAVDVFLTGKAGGARPPVDQKFAGYTYAYNRPLLAERVHDILTAVAHARGPARHTVHLVGFDKAGPWVVVARGLCDRLVARTAADLNQFRFEKVAAVDDEMMLPGALRYGGLSAFAALAAPGEMYLHNARGTGPGQWLQAAYQAAGGQKALQRQEEKSSPEQVVAWILK